MHGYSCIYIYIQKNNTIGSSGHHLIIVISSKISLFQMLFVPYLARLCGRSVGGRGFRPLLLVLFASVALAIFAYSRSLQNSQGTYKTYLR